MERWQIIGLSAAVAPLFKLGFHALARSLESLILKIRLRRRSRADTKRLQRISGRGGSRIIDHE